jgi:hypothetical protein
LALLETVSPPLITTLDGVVVSPVSEAVPLVRNGAPTVKFSL